MLLQINQLFLLDLRNLCGGTSLVIAIIRICLLSSIMTLGKFLQDAVQFKIYRCFDVIEQILHYCFTLESFFSRAPIKEITRIRVAMEDMFFHKI